MMIEERTRFEVLLENLQTSVNVIAEGHVVLVERLDRIDGRLDKLEAKVERLEIRFDGFEKRLDTLETKVDKLGTKVDKLGTKVEGLEVFASDAQRRLQRIETRLALNGSRGSSPRRKVISPALPKHRKKA